MTNINIEIFKRTAPVKKIEIIKNLTQDELGRVTEETILKIVKETGRRLTGSRNYEFYVHPDRRKGNNWNSVVEGIWLYKGKLSVMVYVQFDNTDTSLIVPFQYFFKKGDFRGTVKRDDRYKNPQTHYYVYDEKDKAEVLRSFCLEYINTKYKSKLSTNNKKTIRIMCKFNKPQISANVTADERRSLMFNALYSADLSEETEKKANLTYISWSQAWKVFKIFYPSATYKIFTNPNTGLPVFESEMGLMVHTSVQADGIEYEDWLPVMDYNNRAMKSIPYTIQVYDKQSKQYIEKRIEAATTFDCNSAIQRSMVRAIARHGLGLYIYNGFEHICDDSEQPTNNVTTQQKGNGNQPVQRQQNNSRSQVKPVQAPVKDEAATIKEEIIAAKDVTSLVSLYLDYTEAIESNPELKNLLTNRKKALKTLNS